MGLRTTFLQHWWKMIIVFLALVLAILFWQRERIAENKFTKAKLEMMKALMNDDIDRAKEVLDSLM